MHTTLIIGIAGRGATWTRAVKAHPEFELTGMAAGVERRTSGRNNLTMPRPRFDVIREADAA
jgi:hypothetical protein